VNRASVSIALLAACNTFAHAAPLALNIGEPFAKARAELYANGWRADPLAHAASGEYMGLDRELVQSGFTEVDYCSVDKSLCVLQYTKGTACLRLHTRGEHIRWMKVESWSDDCRERGTDEVAHLPPSDVRYLAQWRNECENYGRCEGIDRFLVRLKKKYARNPAIINILKSYEYPVEAAISYLKPNMPFIRARALILQNGWKPVSMHLYDNYRYDGVEKELARRKFMEVDSCSNDSARCVLYYQKASACLRLDLIGEHVRGMKVVRWTQKCPSR
jgi:hypothetical protein